MLIVRATKKLLDRLGPPTLQEGEESTALLGQWYATALFWRPQIALLVNEPTLLPVLMPPAPTATLPTGSASRSSRSSPRTEYQTRSSMRNGSTCGIAAPPRPPTAASSA